MEMTISLTDTTLFRPQRPIIHSPSSTINLQSCQHQLLRMLFTTIVLQSRYIASYPCGTVSPTQCLGTLIILTNADGTIFAKTMAPEALDIDGTTKY